MLSAMIMMAAMHPSSPPAERPVACSKSSLAKQPPADTLQRLDDFRAKLAATDRQRLDRALPRDADGGIAQCDAAEGSRASCEAAAYMPALRTTGLMPRFLATICPKP